jgi:hypothetical protein
MLVSKWQMFALMHSVPAMALSRLGFEHSQKCIDHSNTLESEKTKNSLSDQCSHHNLKMEISSAKRKI